MSHDSESREISLESVLRLLDRWRHLPAYQLERRVDVLFAMFLPEVLERRFGVEINPLLIPEFPIRKALLKRHDGDYDDSIKADFLALQQSKDGAPSKRAFIVELKTDMASRDTKQEEDLRDAVYNVKLQGLVKGVIKICGGNTPHKRKYVHLLKMLADLQLIECEDDLFDDLFPVRQGHYSRALETIRCQVEQRKEWPSLELVYVQPTTNVIDFNEFADTIENVEQTDTRRKFGCYLREWAAKEAGERDPRKSGSC